MGGQGSGQIRNGEIMEAPVCHMKESRSVCVCSSKTLPTDTEMGIFIVFTCPEILSIL